jgi:hypothetical protein
VASWLQAGQLVGSSRAEMRFIAEKVPQLVQS